MADRQPIMDETAPLLTDGSSAPELTTARPTHPIRTVWLMSLLILFLAGSGSLLSVPQTRLVEDVLCRQYYQDAYGPSEPIDEHLCKNAAIQSELAYIMGFSDTVDAITGTLFWGLRTVI
jgi:PCFT/HCP family folate transporter-like MFS transporter 1/3